ncbi:MAG: sensor histidine kinase [Anaerolineae bacterium]|nr:sensor histidine kinase [Anaerolineae bacterium]
MHVEWDRAIIVIFFFYGLAFYSLGLALLVESGRASQLRLARSMRRLAGFGLLHGTHEWIDMFERELVVHYQDVLPVPVLWGRVALLVTSFIALMAFGEHLLASEDEHSPFWRITISAVIVYVGVSIILQSVHDLDERAWARMLDVLARYILAIPGAVLACWALWQQRAIFRARGMDRFVIDLSIAALALASYGVVGQIFTSESVIFPSTVINAALFDRVFGFPVQLLRAVLAAIVALSMIRVLRAIEVENEQRMAAFERAQQDAERRSHAELAQLNTELQIAHDEATRLLNEVRRRDALRGEFLQRITAAQENERKRIARELHDGTGQVLTGMALGLRGIAANVADEHDQLAQQLATLQTMATSAIGELRHLINDLRPPQLDDMGLISALRWMVSNFDQRGDLKAEFEVVGDPLPLSPEIEVTLFRITQEGLLNVIKHAQATWSKVCITFAEDVRLTVQDNGVGFETDKLFQDGKPRMTWGLVGMQERAGLIKAQIAFDSTPGQGTTLTIWLPVNEPVEVASEDV